MSTPSLVAEVSSNHQRELERCLRFVDAAADVGCTGIKFQQFRIRELFAPEALRFDPSLLEREAWELPEDFNAPIAERAHGLGISFASTPFYLDAVPVLEPLVDFFKIASYQLLWHDMLREVARTKKPVALATGMATLDEVRAAVDVLRGAGCDELTLLHCVSTYPTPPDQANLAALDTLRDAFGGPVGWSDHTVSVDVVRRAVTRFGARMVELHFDLEGEGEEFAAGHCWLPDRVRTLVGALGAAAGEPQPETHVADGDGLKAPRPSELEERRWRTDPSDGLRPLLEVRPALREGAG